MSDDDVRNCPECGSDLPIRARTCPCGWGKHGKQTKPALDPQRFQCAWVADGMRCRYPGNLSSSTNGTGPWFCRWHFRCDDPVHGARLVEQSQSYRSENSSESHNAEITASLIRFGRMPRNAESPKIQTEQCRAWVMAKLKAGITKPLPYDPSKQCANDSTD